MTRLAVILSLIVALALPAPARERTLEDPGSATLNPVRGYAWRVDEQGDSMLVIALRGITVFPELKFKNKKEEQFYWRTVRDVRLTLPYAKLISETLIETYEYIETFATKKEREKYLKEMESALFEQYKPVLKKFSKRQAKVLVKLIQRQSLSRLVSRHILAGIRQTVRRESQERLSSV